MTREQFLDFIQHPENMGAAESIASLTGQFPYCQPLRYLYLKQLAVSDSVQYPQQLKITAAMAPDRTRLFRLIHPEPDGPDQETAASAVFASTSALTTDSTNNEPALPYISEEENATSATLTEYEAPAEESKMSVEEIVNQRLRELNLWQEPEITATGETQEEVQSSTAIPEEPSAEETTEEPVWSPQPEYRLPEEPATEKEEIQQVSDHTATENADEVVQSPEVSAADPLDEIIREGLLETRLRNSEYFDDQLLEEIAAAPIAVEPSAAASEVTIEHPEKKEEKEPVTVTAGTETYSTHTRESHSFTEWLKLNHAADEKKNADQDAAMALPVQENTGETEAEPIEEDIPVDISEDSSSQMEMQAAAYSSESTTISEEKNITADLSQNKPAEQPKQPSVANVRFIFVKSATEEAVNKEPAPVVVKESPGPVYNAPSIAEPVKTPAPAPVVAELPPVDLSPANETLFTGEIIPPKKPIPDPALVDTDPPKPKVPASELIEKFIREEPRITPSKSTFYSPSNMAKKSIVEPEDLITETLANIYAQQGNFKKAISFYQKLSLKFPEKSRYFAALIEELKKKSNS